MKSFIIENGMFKLGDLQETYPARLKRLIKTPVNSMYGFLDHGSRVLEYFHMKSSTETVMSILNEIKNLVLSYEKNVIKLLGLTASITTPNNSAADKLEITLTYEHGNIINKTVVIDSKPTGEN